MAKPAESKQRDDSPLTAGSVLMLLLIAAAVLTGLWILHRVLAARIEHNNQLRAATQLQLLVPSTLYDNDVLADRISIASPLLGSPEPVTIHRARRHGMPVAAIIPCTAPDGYGGPIELLLAVDHAGTVLGVLVLSHQETPGLGDAFAWPESSWLDDFRGRSLADPEPRGWTVLRDGGEFDQFTGATTTPRAITGALRRALEFYQQNRERIFSGVPAQETR